MTTDKTASLGYAEQVRKLLDLAELHSNDNVLVRSYLTILDDVVRRWGDALSAPSIAFDRLTDHISHSPSRNWGEATVGHTGIKVEPIVYGVWVGATEPEICADYSDMTHTGIVVACWYATRYQPRRWGKRWGAWLAANEDRLWHHDWANIPLPPRQATA